MICSHAPCGIYKRVCISGRAFKPHGRINIKALAVSIVLMGRMPANPEYSMKIDRDFFADYEACINHEFLNKKLAISSMFHPSCGGRGVEEFQNLSSLGPKIWQTVCLIEIAATYPKLRPRCMVSLAASLSEKDELRAIAASLDLAPHLVFHRQSSISVPNEKMMKVGYVWQSGSA